MLLDWFPEIAGAVLFHIKEWMMDREEAGFEERPSQDMAPE